MSDKENWWEAFFRLPSCAPGHESHQKEYLGSLLEKHAPQDVIAKYANRVLVVSHVDLGAATLYQDFELGDRAVVVINRRVLPEQSLSGDECEKLFVFWILHELGHLECGHRPPCTHEMQDEADAVALKWFNEKRDKEMTADDLKSWMETWSGFWVHPLSMGDYAQNVVRRGRFIP